MDSYHIILNTVLFLKVAVCACLLIILTSQHLFTKTPKWRWAFIVFVVIYIMGNLADAVDGASDIQELRYYALARHISALGMFVAVMGMHWHMFRGPLLHGTFLSRFSSPKK